MQYANQEIQRPSTTLAIGHANYRKIASDILLWTLSPRSVLVRLVRPRSPLDRAIVEGNSIAARAGVGEAVMADLLRRTGQFGQAVTVCEQGLQKELETTVRQVLVYEAALAKKRDGKCHRVDEAMAYRASGA